MRLDTKASGLKHASHKSQRVFLPRLFDVVLQTLQLMGRCHEQEALEWFVLDFSKAFWQIPLHASEQKYFVARLMMNGQNKYVVFLRTAQGSRGAPLTWARYAALLMRLTQSLVDEDSLRLQCFVDDPIAVVKGDVGQRRAIVAMIMLVWEALSCKLSYSKGQYGSTVSWIGGELRMGHGLLHAQVKQSIIEDIRMSLQEIGAQNVLSKKVLESLAGKINHAAGLLLTLRPFLQQL